MDDIATDLLEQAVSGDIVAFEQIYKATSGFVYNVALKITHNNEDAQEVTQDVFMKIHRNLKNFAFRSKFKTWVYRITVNTAINRYHKSKRENKDMQDYDSLSGVLSGEDPAAKSLQQSENEKKITSLLGILSPAYKACLILREIEGLSYLEIAAALKIPLNTVRSRLKRARQILLEAVRKGLVKDAV